MENKMNSENEPTMYETAPEPMDPDQYKNLTQEQQDQMRKLFAENTNMTNAEALKIVLGPEKEEK